MLDSMTPRLKWGSGVSLAVAAAAALGLLPAAPAAQAPGVAPDRAFLSGVAVGGLTRPEVEKMAGELSARLLAMPLRISLGQRSERTTPARLGAKVDVKAAVDVLFAAGERDAGALAWLRMKLSGPDRKSIPMPVELTGASAARALRRFAIRVGVEPKDARVTRAAGKLRVVPGRPGRELDGAALSAAVTGALNAEAFRERLAGSLRQEARRSAWLAAQAPIEIPAATRTALPRITPGHLKGITAELARFSTSLGGSSRNRLHNIRLASRAIDGTALLPGDVFSYNDVVGPRVPAAGYREAPVMVRGELQPGTGGGICQVSSTLYNAVLLADLAIVRRQHHGFPVGYVPAGRDATVVDGLVDFRFRNSLPHPVALAAAVEGHRMVIRIYGDPEDRREVELLSSRISRVPAGMKTVLDPKLAKGRRVVVKSAKSGRRVTLTRVVKKDGQVLRREVVSRDYYRPFPGVVRVGTREPQPAPQPAGKSPKETPGPASPAGPAVGPAGPSPEPGSSVR